MPKKRPVTFADSYLKKKIKLAEDALLETQSVWAHYLKKNDPLRIELNDLCRRYQAFGKAAADFLEK
jgi:hypothetical protein